jgi:hypothetical protein
MLTQESKVTIECIDYRLIATIGQFSCAHERNTDGHVTVVDTYGWVI